MAPAEPVALDGRRFGRNLRVQRGLLDLYQTDLADKSGVGVATIRALEGQKRARVQARTAAKLANALGTTVAELYGYEE